MRGSPWSLKDNPLYDYQCDLQEKRISLVEALAPRRHLAIHIWSGAAFVILWALDTYVQELKGFPSLLLALLGPFALFVGPYLAGWEAQLTAVKNYPSPLDSPQALEMLLSTPLTETEIVTATVGAYAHYPFIGWSFGRFALVLANSAILVVLVASTVQSGSLPMDVLVKILQYYLPAAFVLVYLPIFAGLELLMVPSEWLTRRDDRSHQGVRSRGSAGWLLSALIMVGLVWTNIASGGVQSTDLSAQVWTIVRVCAMNLLIAGVVIVLVIAVLPSHLARLRRG